MIIAFEPHYKNTKNSSNSQLFDRVHYNSINEISDIHKTYIDTDVAVIIVMSSSTPPGYKTKHRN